MCIASRNSYARTLRSIALLIAAWCVLGLAESNKSYATLFNTSSSNIDIQVVDSSGNLDAKGNFLGTDSFGLPAIKITERYGRADGETTFWGDVEVEVSINVGDHGSSNPFFNFIDKFHDIVDSIFPWDTSSDEPSSQDEQVSLDDLVIGVDKIANNKTGSQWLGFGIELGTGVGGSFVPSSQSDDLHFVTDPMFKETTSFYESLPESVGLYPDMLQWNADGINSLGQGFKDKSRFWFGVHLPADMFEQDNFNSNWWSARFTLRQHAGPSTHMVPEPTAMALALCGSIAGILRRRHRSN